MAAKPPRGQRRTGDIHIANEALACVQETEHQLGTIDALVYCAGRGSKGNMLTCTPEEWHAMFDVHVHAAYHLCRHVAPKMVENRGGHYPNLFSPGLRGIKNALAYGTVKGAVAQLTWMLAH
jgi:NAD(P)-dependent dehydrogenase (short-subunit alcohol dehydrogenase family)